MERDADNQTSPSSDSQSGASSLPKCQQGLQSFGGPLARRFQPIVRTGLRQASGMQEDHPVLVVGTPEAIGAIPELDSALSFALEDSVLHVRGERDSSPTDVLLAHGPSPWNSSRSMHVAVASRRENATEYAAGGLPLTLSRGRYQILRNERLTAVGQFGNTTWTPAPSQQHRSLRSGGPAVETEHVRIYAVDESTFSETRIRRIARRKERVHDRVQALLGPAPTTAAPVDYYLFADAQSLGTLGGEVPPETMLMFPAPHFTRWNDSLRFVDVVPGYASTLSYPREAVIWARDAQGPPASSFLEMGVAVISETGPSEAPPYRRRAERLHRAGLVPALDSLLSKNVRRRFSPLLVEPLAGAFVDFLRDRWGSEAFRRRYRSWTLQGSASPSLREDWRGYLDTLGSNSTPYSRGSSDTSPTWGHESFQKGLTIAYANGPVKSPAGYASAAADRSMANARQLGASAVAIVPYTEIPAADTAVALLPRRHRFDGEAKIIGGESDASIAHAIHDAHQQDLAVMLKPQFGAHVEWPGAIQMDSAAEWDRFFRAYRRWIVHYALLAQRYDAEQLAIGTELVHAARKRPGWWRETIAKLRHVYNGSLTYASHWENTDRIPFWDALDVVGINAYSPLSENQSPSDSALVAGAERSVQRWAALHHRTDRPVVLTEAGASNRAAPWTMPYAELEDRPVQPHDQARTYAALIEAVRDEKWIRGVYWWRWPVSFSASGPFDLRGTPAADTLRDWYSGES